MPQNLETVVGDRGLKLSGGEKQRMALARLFLKKPKICIFDEATSSLDRKTELIIQNNIDTFLPGITKIVITHRPFLINKADKVLMLSKEGLIQKKDYQKNFTPKQTQEGILYKRQRQFQG